MNYNFLNNDDKPIQGLPVVRPAENNFKRLLEQINEEYSLLSDKDRTAQEILRGDLDVYKRAYVAERERCEKLRQEFDTQRKDLKQQLKGHRIVTLIDGDGASFNTDLIAQGKDGGHIAAQKLSDSITQHLNNTYGANDYQLWVYVFLGKRSLSDAFERAGLTEARTKLDDFIMGFNQAAERFIMVDVGGTKETKIKAFLENEIRLPQTEKIIFAGCHEYFTTIQSQKAAGLKLIHLRGYGDMAAGIEPKFPSFSIPDLFISQKLTPVATASTTIQCNVTPTKLPLALDDRLAPTNDGQSTPISYFSAVQTSQKRPDTPESHSSGSTLSNARTRQVIPNLPLSKHDPRPCLMEYLSKSKCKFGAECKHAHDYDLDSERLKELRLDTKRLPCQSINKGEVCAWGDDCLYGHFCPYTSKCLYLSKGQCKFGGADLHKEEE